MDSVNFFLNPGKDVNGLYPDYTLLEMAIGENQKEIVNLLINRHADINLMNHGNTPLLYATFYSQRYHDIDIIRLLIEGRADLNKPGRSGVTPLIYACRSNNYQAAVLFYEKGADVSAIDFAGLNFFYYVLRGNDLNIRKYFLEKGFVIPRLSSVTDGPYIHWVSNYRAEVSYIKYDSLSDSIRIISRNINVNKNHLKIPAGENTKSSTIILNADQPDSMEFHNVSKIFAIGDLHGEYAGFVQLLKAGRIINKDLNWIWGKGHLVLCGDVFDRGDSVTNILWLIYKLEHQAVLSGGKVHYVLGNHELMVLRDNNKYYVNEKYILLCAKLGLDYHDFFSPDDELGKWIRSKNIIIKINNILFVHGGIPPEFPGIEKTIEKMNSSIHYFINISPDSIDPLINHYLIEPTWYRGYFEKRDQSSELNEILNYYQAGHIVVGHTPVNEISALHDGKVIAINVPFDEPAIKTEGLLIQNNKFYVVDTDGIYTEMSGVDP
jgi:hypothetical protein